MSYVRRPSRRASVPSYAAPTYAPATSSSRGACQPPNGNPHRVLVGAAGRLPDEVEGGEQLETGGLVLCAPGHVLEGPGIAIWVGERGVQDPAGVLDRAHGRTAVDECRAGLLDVADHQVQAAQGSGRHIEPRDARGQGDRAG